MIPKSALLLGLAGLVPFIACALAGLTGWPGVFATMADRAMLHYGIIILAFMSGVLWGFATKVEGRAAAVGYGLSVMPALWAFFTTMGGPETSFLALMAGYAGLLYLDFHFWRRGLAPSWWMRLRLILSSGVLASLALGLYA